VPAAARSRASTRPAAPARTRRRRREPAEKQARILAAARRLFVARGFGATTTADLARAAEVSEGIVFHHFGSKEGVLVAVAAEYGRGLAEAMLAAREDAGAVARAREHGAPAADAGEDAAEAGEDAAEAGEDAAEAMLREAFAYVRERGPLSRLLMLAPAAMDLGSAIHATRQPIVAAIAGTLEQLQPAGLVRPLDARITAELLHALVERALVECFVRGDGSREADYLRETVACVVGATARAPTPIE
jgi:AcrR family transcriptional regulator